MIDLALERQIDDLKELLELWQKFHDFFSMALKGNENSKENEMAFLELKSRIASLHDVFLSVLSHSDANVGQSVLTIISKTITLKHVYRLTDAEIKKLEIEWHESYLLLNETIGELEDKKEALAQINHLHHTINHFVNNIGHYSGEITRSIYFKIIVFIIVILFVIFGIPAFGIYDYSELRTNKYGKPVYYTAIRAYRSFINSDALYNTAEEAKDDYKKSKLPETMKLVGNGADQNTAITQLYAGLGMQFDLNGSKSFSSMKINVDRMDIEVHVFMFDTPAKTEEITQKLTTAIDKENANSQSTFRNTFAAFRKANCLIIIYAPRRDDLRETLKGLY